MTKGPILLIEDTPSLRLLYGAILRTAGYDVATAADATAGLAQFLAMKPPVVLLNLMLPDRDGLDLMHEILAQAPLTRVVVITANASISKAVAAMRVGAQDSLVKPFDAPRLIDAVGNALASVTAAPIPDAAEGSALASMIGTSPAMAEIHARVRSVARSMATVFITGESGTGKELCARAIHELSGRVRGAFVPLNCGAIPPELLESEVFGHVTGSFTGATEDRPGAAIAGDGGTLFLDEICELDRSLQTRLLRFLQTSTLQPVGASRPLKVDVRIICATNRDPREEVRRGRFREDLYYRLHVIPIQMPPLRARGTDVLEIAKAALALFGREEGRSFHGIAPDVAELLQGYRWPGNVRQLFNRMRHIVVLNDGPLVTREMLSPDLLDLTVAAPDEPGATSATLPIDDLIGLSLAEIERLVIERTIASFHGSVPRAARILDVAPSTLYRKREVWKARDAIA